MTKYLYVQEEQNSEQLNSPDVDEEAPEVPTVTREDLIARREDVQIDALRYSHIN